MARYEITAVANGNEIKRSINVAANASDKQVIERFIAEWVEHGDDAPTSITITQRWSVQ